MFSPPDGWRDATKLHGWLLFDILVRELGQLSPTWDQGQHADRIESGAWHSSWVVDTCFMLFHFPMILQYVFHYYLSSSRSCGWSWQEMKKAQSDGWWGKIQCQSGWSFTQQPPFRLGWAHPTKVESTNKCTKFIQIPSRQCGSPQPIAFSWFITPSSL